MTTVYAITYALLAPTIAALAAAVPRKRLLLSGLGLFVVANLATAVAPTFGIALLTRALAGLGAAMFSPTATGAGSMLVPPERRRLRAFHHRRRPRRRPRPWVRRSAR